jgi:hypothetical protein
MKVGAMKKVLIFAAVAEAATGVALALVFSSVGQLLLGVEFAGIAVPVARVAGIALIGLGVACWPGPPVVGMLPTAYWSRCISPTSALLAVWAASCCGRRSPFT